MKTIENIFPLESQIPNEWKLENFIEQREYLINGELRKWDGPMNEVISPVSINNGAISTKNIIGNTPLLTEKESLEALDAAVIAYKNGTGVWPTMSVAKRIAHVEKFLLEMKKQRTAVVKLLMWEIGKNLPDSEKEFDRTCIYIEDTIKELKNLDHDNSKFENEEGVIAQERRVPFGVALCKSVRFIKYYRKKYAHAKKNISMICNTLTNTLFRFVHIVVTIFNDLLTFVWNYKVAKALVFL